MHTWGDRIWHCKISGYTEWGKNVIGLYQQEVNILSHRGSAVAKQQEYRNQSHFCFFKKGAVFAVSSLWAIPYDLQRPFSRDLKVDNTKGYNTCQRQIFQNIQISIYVMWKKSGKCTATQNNTHWSRASWILWLKGQIKGSMAVIQTTRFGFRCLVCQQGQIKVFLCWK